MAKSGLYEGVWRTGGGPDVLKAQQKFHRDACAEGRPEQPYAIAMKDGSAFGIGGLWENGRPRIDAAVACRADANVADLDAGQQAGER